MAKKHVFISIGTPYADEQGKFLDALIELLRDCDIEPRAVNKTDFFTANPLKEISRIMRECDAAIIVAYQRTYFDSGVEKPKSAHETALSAVRYPTPWNQIEAAMAVALGLPLIVMVETGLRQEGLLEDKFDWYIERLPISGDAFADKSVRRRIAEWCRRVQTETPSRASRGRIDGEMTIADMGKILTIKAALALIAASVALFVVGMMVGDTPVGDYLLHLFGKK